jgi:hypothetical protein
MIKKLTTGRIPRLLKIAMLGGALLVGSTAIASPTALAATPAAPPAVTADANEVPQAAAIPTPVPPGAGSPALEQQRQFLAQQARVSPLAVTCWDYVTLLANAVNRYVSTELLYGTNDGHNNYAMLHATRTEIGPWEQYLVCRDGGTGLTNIGQRANAFWVAAEFLYPEPWKGELRARTENTKRGPWENFYTPQPPTGHTVIWIRSAGASDHNYVSVEKGYSGIYQNMLRVRNDSVGPWENFTW